MVDSVVPFFLFFLFAFQECSKSSFEIMVRGGGELVKREEEDNKRKEKEKNK